MEHLSNIYIFDNSSELIAIRFSHRNHLNSIFLKKKKKRKTFKDTSRHVAFHLKDCMQHPYWGSKIWMYLDTWYDENLTKIFIIRKFKRDVIFQQTIIEMKLR